MAIKLKELLGNEKTQKSETNISKALIVLSEKQTQIISQFKAVIKHTEVISKELKTEFAKVEKRYKESLKLLSKEDSKIALSSKANVKLISVELKKTNKTLVTISKILKANAVASNLMVKKLDRVTVGKPVAPVTSANVQKPDESGGLLGTLIEAITGLFETAIAAKTAKSIFGKPDAEKAAAKQTKADRVKTESEKYFNTKPEEVKPETKPKIEPKPPEAPKTSRVTEIESSKAGVGKVGGTLLAASLGVDAYNLATDEKARAQATQFSPGESIFNSVKTSNSDDLQTKVAAGIAASADALVGAVSVITNTMSMGTLNHYLENQKIGKYDVVKNEGIGSGLLNNVTNMAGSTLDVAKDVGDLILGGLPAALSNVVQTGGEMLGISKETTQIISDPLDKAAESLESIKNSFVNFGSDLLTKAFGPKLETPVNETPKPTVTPNITTSQPTLFSGGPVPGEWNGLSGSGGDTVLAKLTPGEFVVPRNVTQKNYNTLQSMMNSATGYAEGGLVGAPEITEILDANRMDIKPGDKPVVFTDSKINNIKVEDGVNLDKSFGDKILGIGDSISSGLLNAFGIGNNSGVAGLPSLASNAAAMMGLKDKDPRLTGDLSEVFSRMTAGYFSPADETRIDFNDPNYNKKAQYTGAININQRSGQRGDVNYALPKIGERENISKDLKPGEIQGPNGPEKAWTPNSTPQLTRDPTTRPNGPFNAIQAGVDFKGGKIIGLSDAQSRAVAAETLRTESGGNKAGIAAENKQGFLGQYQFGAEALASAGLMDAEKVKAAKSQSKNWYSGGQKEFMADPKNWKIEGGKAAFAGSKEIQDKAFVDFTNNNIKAGIKAGAISANDSPEKIASYAKASHLVGAGGANNLFVRGIDKADANGTKASTYAKQGANSLALAGDIEKAKGNPQVAAKTPTTPNVTPEVTKAEDYKVGNKTGALSKANQMSDQELLAWKTQTNAGMALGKTLNDMRSSQDPKISALADKIELTSGNKGEHVKNSNHYKGNAFDFNQSALSAEEKATFKSYAEKQGLKQDAVVKGKTEPWHYTYRGEDLTKPKIEGTEPKGPEQIAKTEPTPEVKPEIAQTTQQQLNRQLDPIANHNIYPEQGAGTKHVANIMNANIAQEADKIAQAQPQTNVVPMPVATTQDPPATESGNTDSYALNPFSQFASYNRMSLLRGAASIPGMAIGY